MQPHSNNADNAAGISSATQVVSPVVKRLDYLDAARALAIIGMLLTHLGDLATIPDSVFYVASGRSSITFAVLAGVSAVLMVRSVNRRSVRGGSGATGQGLITRASAWSLTRRALALYVLGLVLVLFSSGPIVILCTYAVLLLLAIPLLKIRSTKILVGLAGVSALVLPLVSFALRAYVLPEATDFAVVPTILDVVDPEAYFLGIRGLLIDGMYPVLTWIPFLIAGLALGRLLLGANPQFGRVFTVGAVLAAMSYGTHAVLMAKSSYVDDVLTAIATANPEFENYSRDMMLEEFGILFSSGWGVTDTDRPISLLLAIPHSGSITEIFGGIGVVCMLLPTLAWIGAKAPAVIQPFALLGRGALTYYVTHILALTVLVIAGVEHQNALIVIGAFVLIPMIIAYFWFKKFRRGPLEAAMHWVAK